IAPAAEIAEGEIPLGDVRDPPSGKAEIEPILAMLGCGRAVQHARRIALEPYQMAALVAGVEPAAGHLVDRAPDTIGGELPHDPRGTGIEPEPSRRDGLAV